MESAGGTPELYARIGYGKTQKAGWSGEFTVSVKGGSEEEVVAALRNLTASVESMMRAEVARLNESEEQS